MFIFASQRKFIFFSNFYQVETMAADGDGLTRHPWTGASTRRRLWATGDKDIMIMTVPAFTNEEDENKTYRLATRSKDVKIIDMRAFASVWHAYIDDIGELSDSGGQGKDAAKFEIDADIPKNIYLKPNAKFVLMTTHFQDWQPKYTFLLDKNASLGLSKRCFSGIEQTGTRSRGSRQTIQASIEIIPKAFVTVVVNPQECKALMIERGYDESVKRMCCLFIEDGEAIHLECGNRPQLVAFNASMMQTNTSPIRAFCTILTCLVMKELRMFNFVSEFVLNERIVCVLRGLAAHPRRDWSQWGFIFTSFKRDCLLHWRNCDDAPPLPNVLEIQSSIQPGTFTGGPNGLLHCVYELFGRGAIEHLVSELAVDTYPFDSSSSQEDDDVLESDSEEDGDEGALREFFSDVTPMTYEYPTTPEPQSQTTTTDQRGRTRARRSLLAEINQTESEEADTSQRSSQRQRTRANSPTLDQRVQWLEQENSDLQHQLLQLALQMDRLNHRFTVAEHSRAPRTPASFGERLDVERTSHARANRLDHFFLPQITRDREPVAPIIGRFDRNRQQATGGIPLHVFERRRLTTAAITSSGERRNDVPPYTVDRDGLIRRRTEANIAARVDARNGEPVFIPFTGNRGVVLQRLSGSLSDIVEQIDRIENPPHRQAPAISQITGPEVIDSFHLDKVLRKLEDENRDLTDEQRREATSSVSSFLELVKLPDCIICCSKPIDCIVLECCHVSACFGCINRYSREKCCECRGQITKIAKFRETTTSSSTATTEGERATRPSSEPASNSFNATSSSLGSTINPADIFTPPTYVGEHPPNPFESEESPPNPFDSDGNSSSSEDIPPVSDDEDEEPEPRQSRTWRTMAANVDPGMVDVLAVPRNNSYNNE